jgi:L-fuconolactonase
LIDAHVHIWRLGQNGCLWPPPDLAAIHHDHDLGDLRRVVAGTGVKRIVLVQSQESDADTEWLLAQSAASSIAAGVVGWIDPAASDVAAGIARLTRLGPLVGVRIMAQDRAPEWLADPAFQAMFECLSDRGLALDLLVRPQHLLASARLAARFPALRMIIDHGAKPPIAENGFAAWREEIARAAARANVSCKLSGLITEAAPGQPLSELTPYIDALLGLFGPDRLVWGSDWPVVNLAGDYRAWFDFARAAIPPQHQDAVFGGNARAAYGLGA